MDGEKGAAGTWSVLAFIQLSEVVGKSMLICSLKSGFTASRPSTKDASNSETHLQAVKKALRQAQRALYSPVCKHKHSFIFETRRCDAQKDTAMSER